MIDRRRHTLPTGRVSVFVLMALLTACGTKNQVDPILTSSMPAKIIWAWERPEDLRFLDPNEYGVAFLAQTIFLDNSGVTPKPRRQPLELPEGIYVIAVTRIETNKDGKKRPSFDAEMQNKVVSLVKNTLELPNVRGVQIDFDAVVSERSFYRSMMKELAKAIREHDAKQPTNDQNSETHHSSLITHHSLTMTSLASWCTGDAWFNDFPVDEAVPMAFQMGADSEKIRNYLRNGNDWNEPLCRGSYGISLEEGRFDGMKDGRRMYYFKNSSWKAADLAQLN